MKVGKGYRMARTTEEYAALTSAPAKTPKPDVPEPGEAVSFTQAGSYFTALDADGNEVGKVQGKDAFFTEYPSLKPAEG